MCPATLMSPSVRLTSASSLMARSSWWRNIIRHLAHSRKTGRELTATERFDEVRYSAKEVANPMFFGVLIITVVYVPILALTGIEGKMFRPMALTVIRAARFAQIGSTYTGIMTRGCFQTDR